MSTIEVGDLIEAVHPSLLASGAGYFSVAVVARVEPLMLVSVRGDMIWHRVAPEHVCVIGRASKRVLLNVLTRAAKEDA